MKRLLFESLYLLPLYNCLASTSAFYNTNRKENNNTCAAENVIPPGRDPPHGNACLDIVGNLILKDIANPADVEHIWQIRKVAGRLLIQNTQLEMIDLRNLTSVSYSDQYPGIAIVGNKKLKTIEWRPLPCPWNDRFIDFDRPIRTNNVTRYLVIVNNGDYRMTKKNHQLIKACYRSTEQSLFLIDVEQTRVIDRKLDFGKTELNLMAIGVALIPMSMIAALGYCRLERIIYT